MRKFKTGIAIVICFCFYTGITLAEPQKQNIEPNQPRPIDVSDIKDANYSPYLLYLKEHGKSPIEYVLDKFKDHDVVILGEMHGQKESLELIRDLIEPLYHKAGVRYFAMEILRHKNTALVNQLVTAKEYDQQLALRIFRDFGHPNWGYKEYMDILKAIWELNNKLPAEAEKFKVVALDKGDWDAIDMPQIPSPEKYEEFVNAHDPFMAGVVESEVLDKGGKVLIQIGYMHSFSRYRLDEKASRFGYLLHEKYKDRIFQVCLHQPHVGPEVLTGSPPTSIPVIIDFMETVMSKNANKPVGFDMDNSPFANLKDRKSLYFASQGNIIFSDIAQGYIFIKPIRSLGKMTWVEGFIDQSNFERAKAIAEKQGWIAMLEKSGILKHGECDTPKGLDKLFKLITSN